MREQDLIDYVLSVFYLSGYFKSDEVSDYQLSHSSFEDFREASDIFSPELCSKPTIPSDLVKKEEEG